jgi:hypothetical protein
MSNPNDQLTISALAAAYGRDRRTVSRMLRGMAPSSTSEYRGRTLNRYRRGDVEAVITAPTDHDSLKAAFERLHGARADILKLKRRLRDGDAICADVILAELVNRFIRTRSAMLGFTNKYGAQFTQFQGYEDRSKARADLKALLRRAMEEIGRDLCQPFTWEKTK